jgi:hypothetical protein
MKNFFIAKEKRRECFMEIRFFLFLFLTLKFVFENKLQILRMDKLFDLIFPLDCDRKIFDEAEI